MSVNIFARWSSEEECLQEMLGLHDEESALAIVASISNRVADGTLFKSMEGELHIISKADDPEIVVVGPCSWEKIDPEDDLITASAMSKFFHKWFNVVPERYQNITLNHKSFQAGIPLLKYQGSDGEMYYTHVHEKGAMLVSKVRDADGLVQTKDLREKILNGTYKSYSIYGVPTDIVEKKIDGRDVNVINDIDPGDVTYCRAGMNDMANFDVVKTKDCDEDEEEDEDDDKKPKPKTVDTNALMASAKGMTLDEINDKIAELRATLEANQDKIQEYYDSRPDTPDWVDDLYDENSALYDELSAWREARVERIVEDAKAPQKEEKKVDVHKIIQDALQPLSKSIEALEARTRKKIESGEDKPKSHEEVSKVMDERTLETALKVREIFKELKPVE